MSLSTPLRTVAVPTGDVHGHTGSCWWDHLACRWAGPAHPAPPVRRSPQLPEPRPAAEDALPVD